MLPNEKDRSTLVSQVPFDQFEVSQRIRLLIRTEPRHPDKEIGTHSQADRSPRHDVLNDPGEFRLAVGEIVPCHTRGGIRRREVLCISNRLNIFRFIDKRRDGRDRNRGHNPND